MIRIRRRLAATLSVAVIAALSVVTLGYSTAAAHTTTDVLLPTGAGSYTAWGPNTGQSEYTALNESGSANCGNLAGTFISTGTANSRESVAVSLADIPNGSVITEVVVQAFHRSESNSPSLRNGTFRTFARFNGSDTDAASDIVSSLGTGCTQADATINVADSA